MEYTVLSRRGMYGDYGEKQYTEVLEAFSDLMKKDSLNYYALYQMLGYTNGYICNDAMGYEISQVVNTVMKELQNYKEIRTIIKSNEQNDFQQSVSDVYARFIEGLFELMSGNFDKALLSFWDCHDTSNRIISSIDKDEDENLFLNFLTLRGMCVYNAHVIGVACGYDTEKLRSIYDRDLLFISIEAPNNWEPIVMSIDTYKTQVNCLFDNVNEDGEFESIYFKKAIRLEKNYRRGTVAAWGIEPYSERKIWELELQVTNSVEENVKRILQLITNPDGYNWLELYGLDTVSDQDENVLIDEEVKVTLDYLSFLGDEIEICFEVENNADVEVDMYIQKCKINGKVVDEDIEVSTIDADDYAYPSYSIYEEDEDRYNEIKNISFVVDIYTISGVYLYSSEEINITCDVISEEYQIASDVNHESMTAVEKIIATPNMNEAVTKTEMLNEFLAGKHISLHTANKDDYIRLIPSSFDEGNGIYVRVYSTSKSEAGCRREAYHLENQRLVLEDSLLHKESEYIICGNYLINKEWLSKKVIPESNRFDYFEETQYSKLSFRTDGTFVKISGQGTEYERTWTGRYIRDNEIIKCIPDYGNVNFYYIVYNGHITDSAYVKESMIDRLWKI